MLKTLAQTLAGGLLPDRFRRQIPRQIHGQVQTIAGIEEITVVRGIQQSLENAKADGLSFKQWQSSFDIEEFKVLADHRKRTIYSTYMAAQRNLGVLEHAQDNKSRRPYLRYNTVGDDRVRDTHAVLDGVTRPVDDPFWNTYLPPWDFNCRCDVTSLTARQSKIGGSRTTTTPGKPTGRGLTPPTVVRILRRSARPSPGWGMNKKNPLNNATRFFRGVRSRLPAVLRRAFILNPITRRRRTSIWIEKNKDELDS